VDIFAHLGADLFGSVEQAGAHAVVEPINLFRCQAGALGVGVQLRRPEHLVGVGVADSGYKFATDKEPFIAPRKGLRRALRVA
jgi:hypothetical protein